MTPLGYCRYSLPNLRIDIIVLYRCGEEGVFTQEVNWMFGNGNIQQIICLVK